MEDWQALREAAFDLERAYLLGYRPAALWATWGLVLLNIGNYEEAVEKFSQAIALSAENSPESSPENSAENSARDSYNPALYYARRGFAYIQWSKEAKKQTLNDSSEYSKQASCDFDRAIELSEELAITYIHYGYLMIIECKYDKAIEYYQKAITKEFKHYIVHANIAEAYFKRAQCKKRNSEDPIQDYEKSIENYKEAISQKDERLETLFNLAVAYYNLALTYKTRTGKEARKNALESKKSLDKATEKALKSEKSVDKTQDSEFLISKIGELKDKVSRFLRDTLPTIA